MQSDYACQYETLWRRHWWWRAREKFVAAHLRREAQAHVAANRHILDIGCGNGLFFDTLGRYGDVEGIEPDAGLVTDGPNRSRIHVRPFDDFFAPTKRFDWVLMLDVLEHIQDDAAAARRVRAILSPGGLFLLTVPAMGWLWSRHDVANHHFRRYTRASLRTVLTSAGFEVESVRYFFGWTIIPMLLRRLLAPGEGTGEGTYRVRVPPQPVSALMYAKSRCEQWVTGNGRVGLPLGSSLLAVARRRVAI